MRKTKEHEIIGCLKTNNILLDEDMEEDLFKKMNWRIKTANALTLISTSQVFKHSTLLKVCMSYAERFFPMITDCPNFLQLDFTTLVKILASSELFVDSELQVFNAANKWLNYDITKRIKYAKTILLKIRLTLLSLPTLSYILNKEAWLSENDECSDLIKRVLRTEKSIKSSNSRIFSRYCNESFCNIYFYNQPYRIDKIVSNVYNSRANISKTISMLAELKEKRRSYFNVFCIKGKYYVLGGVDDNKNPIMSVEKYSTSTKTWKTIAKMFDGREFFCACSFMDDIFVIGGMLGLGGFLGSCVEFKTKNKKWNVKTKMNKARMFPACSVFEGRIVVCGGGNRVGFVTKTVEAYDHVDDSWSDMPSMIESRFFHKLVAVKNKLFVVSGFDIVGNGDLQHFASCEIFDSVSNKFVLLKQPKDYFEEYIQFSIKVFSIGKNLYIFNNEEVNNNVLVYDMENQKWSVITMHRHAGNIFWYSFDNFFYKRE